MGLLDIAMQYLENGIEQHHFEGGTVILDYIVMPLLKPLKLPAGQNSEKPFEDSQGDFVVRILLFFIPDSCLHSLA
jgi:hypothetical protein